MKFFFADSVDAVDPNYDFCSDRVTLGRNRQYDDLYAHELLGTPPYDGILVSLSLVMGQGRYSQTQRFRLMREGIRNFLRYPCAHYSGDPAKFPIMGDCGSYSYVNMNTPPYRIEEVIEFYEACQFTHAVSPDHIIFEKNEKWDCTAQRPNRISARADYTLSSALEFLRECERRHLQFLPIGAIQGWSKNSTLKYAKKLVSAGYQYIGLGGYANRPTKEIHNLLSEIRSEIPPNIQIHLFGFNRIDKLESFHGIGLTSFDSAAPMVKAFLDDKYNYFAPDGNHYLAIKVPQLMQSEISSRLQSGNLNYEEISILEKKCMEALHSYGRYQGDLDTALKLLRNYETVIGGGKSFLSNYRRTLEERPWENCTCAVCKAIGIDALIYRGLNRNKRRGFHNLSVYYDKLQGVRNMREMSVPCIRIVQRKDRPIYSFAINGKEIQKIASISRIRRVNENDLAGYQRTEIMDHILDIKTYLEKETSILPNSIILAFNKRLGFIKDRVINDWCEVGTLKLPSGEGNKSGWIVDGQQRLAAIRTLTRDEYPVSVMAFESCHVDEEREQFVLINSTRPLPKTLIYELLPAMKSSVPARLVKRQRAYLLLEKLNLQPNSPFYQRIRTLTSRHITTANIKDVSVLRMIENSRENGILHQVGNDLDKQYRILKEYWNAVRRRFPVAWTLTPRESRLTHGAGILSMGYLMDSIGQNITSRTGKLDEESFFIELDKVGIDIPWTSGNWKFGEGMIMPWNQIQNTNRHVDIMANYLLRKYKTADNSSRSM